MIGIKRWNYGVTYRKGGKMKDRHFTDYDKAKKFYERLKKYEDAAIFFKFKPTNWFERFVDHLKEHWRRSR